LRKISFGIIGCGRIASRHAEIISNLASLKAVCDIKPERAKDFEKKYACNSYSDYTNMLELEKDIDVIAVCSPNYLHSQHTIDSLKAAKHVLCEKPMAISVAECRKMMVASDAIYLL